VLNAFIDASEQQPDMPVAAMAHFVAKEAHWEKFKERWKAFLQKNEIKGRFHTSEFLARQGEFQWDDAKHEQVKKEIAQIFNEVGMHGFGVAVNCKAYDEWRLRQKVFTLPDPYYWCLQRMMQPLILKIYEVPEDEGVVIYVDRDNARQKLGESVGQWYGDQLTRKRKVSIQYVSSYDYVGLQAADIASNGSYRYLSHFIKTGEWKVPPIVDGFKRFLGPVQFDVAAFNTPEHFDLWLHPDSWKPRTE
jgi:hypothetical protein